MTPAEAVADTNLAVKAGETLEDGEIVLLVARPSIRLIPAYVAAPILLLLAAAAVVATGKWLHLLSAEKADGMLLALGCVAALATAIQVYRWRSRWYLLTNRRVMRRTGWLAGTVAQCPLRDLVSVEVILFPPEHLAGLGSVCFQTREGFRPDLRWGNVARPEQLAEEVRRAIRRSRE